MEIIKPSHNKVPCLLIRGALMTLLDVIITWMTLLVHRTGCWGKYSQFWMPVNLFLWAAGSPFMTTENKGTNCHTGNLSVPTRKNWMHICDPPPMRAPDFTACILSAVLCLAAFVFPILILLLFISFILLFFMYSVCGPSSCWER